MIDIQTLEKFYHEFMTNILQHLPEGIIEVDLSLLQKYKILDLETHQKDEASITRLFHMIESQDKVTLVSEEFIIWITPDNQDTYSSTYIFIALIKHGYPVLEVGYRSSGVYNVTPRILHLIEHVLLEIQENEKLLASLEDES